MLGMSVPSVKTPQLMRTRKSPLRKAVTVSRRSWAGVLPVTRRASMWWERKRRVSSSQWEMETQKRIVDLRVEAWGVSIREGGIDGVYGTLVSQVRKTSSLAAAVLTAAESSGSL